MKKNMQTRKKAQIEVIFDDQSLILENAFISGTIVDEECGMGMYSGICEVGEIGISLMNMLRGAIKVSHEECGMPYDKAELFINECLKEAFRREIEGNEKEKMREELNKIVKRFMDSQNRP